MKTSNYNDSHYSSVCIIYLVLIMECEHQAATHTQSPEHQTHKLYLFHSICRSHVHSKMLSLDSTPLDGSLSPLEVQLFTVNCTI